MTLGELVSIDYLKSSWEDFYDAVIDALGYENVKRCVPFTLPDLMKMYQRDKNMNIKMKVWRNASGIAFNNKTGKRYFIDSPLRDLMHEKGVTAWSQSEGVSILKRCAERMINNARE